MKILKNFTHIGWVPCISGHLDFGLMAVGLSGETSNGTKRDREEVSINFSEHGYSDDNSRRVLLTSWVNWQDKRPEDGKFRVLLLAKSNRSKDIDSRFLTGTICIFPQEYEKKHPEAYKFFIDDIAPLKNAWDAFEKVDEINSIEWENSQKKVNKSWEIINDKISKQMIPDCGAKEIYFIQFYTDHKGITYLNYAPSQIDANHVLTPRAEYGILRQAFYYLKYSLHIHKHHEQEADALTTIVERDSSNVTNDGKRLAAQLKRELIRIKRTQNDTSGRRDQSTALGIIGYTKSLILGCLEEGLLEKKQYDREKDRLTNLACSFDAQHERLSIITAFKRDSGQWARQWAGFFLSIASLLLLIWVNYNKPSQPSDASFEQFNSILWFLQGDIYAFLLMFAYAIGITITTVKSLQYFYSALYFPIISKKVYISNFLLFIIVASAWGAFLYLLSARGLIDNIF